MWQKKRRVREGLPERLDSACRRVESTMYLGIRIIRSEMPRSGGGGAAGWATKLDDPSLKTTLVFETTAGV